MGEIILRPVPPVAMPFTGERLTSDYGGQTQIEHLHRYLIAREWCRGKDVLDVASGEGYGAALMAQVARSVTGVEIAPDAVAHATGAYAASNLRFVTGDARDLPLPAALFDVVVSFETIEHFAEQAVFLDEVRRVLRPGGLLIVSTPDRDNYSPAETPANPYHVQELTGSEFRSLLLSRFAELELAVQRPIFGSVLWPEHAGAAVPVCFERRGVDHFERSDGLSRPQYWVAFASDSPIAPLPSSVYIDTGRLGMLSPPEYEERLRAAQAQENHAVGVAEQSRSREEVLRHQTEVTLARLQAELLQAQGVAEAHGEHERAASIDPIRAELAAAHVELAMARGEARGLVIANEMTERACLALHAELTAAGRRLTELEAARDRMEQSDAVRRVDFDRAEADARALLSELKKTQARAARAEAGESAIVASSSWRITAPLRSVARRLRRRQS